MLVQALGRVTLPSFWQALKALGPISVTVSGNEISGKEVQVSKV